ncbi:MAG: hypothetical protein EU531_10050 [Promethearchaeota archaeon]|nr:MAG: hypothetical protein EU531_10050 [Candidatus Lokiarchaeota archaeon]
MRNRTLLVLILLIVSSTMISSLPMAISLGVNNKEIDQLNISALSEINTTITINDFPGSLTNWTWAKDQGYCTGSGTLGDPYVISNLFFNTSTLNDNSLSIRNSLKHFIIRNCEFKGHWDYAGIQLYNTSFGRITANMMYPTTGALVWLYNASSNLIYNNNASAGYYYGILIDATPGLTQMNQIYGNVINNNSDAGIQFRALGSQLNLIRDNTFWHNPYGIEIGSFVKNNTILGNHIRNSSICGVRAYSLSETNFIHGNCFFDNALHALDDGLNNEWDDGNKGNFWDNYSGSDADNDGIGDIPYNITGSAGSQDKYPLMSCPTPSLPGIPGYELYIVLLISACSIMGIILFTHKRNHKKYK